MRTAKLFLAGMYVHLALSIAVPIAVLRLGSSSGKLLVFYALAVLAVHILGWVSVGGSILTYRRWQNGRLLSGWRLLKLGAVPFHIVNFFWSALVWWALTAASRGLFFLLIPIPIGVTGLFILQSGVTGWLAVRALREEGEDVFILHSAAQFCPVLDVVSTLLLLRRSARNPNP